MDRLFLVFLVFLVFLILCPLPVLADARIDPDECHVPWDNANTDNEFKLQNCPGTIMQYADGARADGDYYAEHKGLNTGHLARMAVPIREEGNRQTEFVVRTNSQDSATNCNLVTADGTEYVAPAWAAEIRVKRTGDYNRANVEYTLRCTGGVAQ